MKKPYNTTDLDPSTTFEKHIFHRDQFAHYLRWTHILKEAKIGDVIVDFGCGNGNLLEVLYRNRFKPQCYFGLDIRGKTIAAAKERFGNLPFPVDFITTDLIKPSIDLKALNANKVVSFEVAEHVGKQNIQPFLKNFLDCGNKDATYYLSTPNYDPKVGAAGNHTYDSGDGRGVAPQEWDHDELEYEILQAGFEVIKKFGTFASQKDYKPFLRGWQVDAFMALSEYYDSNLVSNLMAPIVPANLARNTLWVLGRKL